MSGTNRRSCSPWFRVLRIAGHLLAGSLTVLLRFPRLDRQQRDQRVTRWAGQLLALVGLRVVVVGQPPASGGGALLAANHVSWLDIYLLYSLLPARFISKAEVRHWPLIGWLAAAAGTEFLVREQKSDAMRMNQIMAGHLRGGDCLALFPEGTTSDGAGLLPFFPSLFQPAVDAGVAVWPVAIRYFNADASRCDEVAYYGETSLGESLWQILKLRGLYVRVEFLPPIASAGLVRRDLARAAEAAIRASLAARSSP